MTNHRAVAEIEAHPAYQSAKTELETKGWAVHYTWVEELTLDDDPERPTDHVTIEQPRHHYDLPYAVAAEVVRLMRATYSPHVRNVLLVREEAP